MDGHRNAPARVRGIALLALLVVVVLVTATGFAAALLDPSGLRLRQDQRTHGALAEAKAALLGYAAADANRPGELPCPDSDGDGRSTPVPDYAGRNCRTLRGWLPWYSLRLEPPRDGAGAPLWYALSPDFRAGGDAVLNSDTPGQLSLDGQDDMVAVILAPGAPVPGQNGRGPGPADALVAAYLEGENADADLRRYLHLPAGGNDRALAITRAEWAAVVEQRVLAEVASALAEYRQWTDPGTGGALPWATAFRAEAPPDPGDTPPARQGSLPFHGPDAWFATDFTVLDWALADGVVHLDPRPGNTVAPGDLRAGGERLVTAATGEGRCAWSALATVRCRGQAEQVCAAPPAACGLPAGVVRRVWAFDLHFSGTPGVRGPAAGAHATRGVALADAALPERATPLLVLTDYDAGGIETGRGELHAGAASAMTGSPASRLVVAGIRLYPALPAWYPANGWHRQVYFALAPGVTPDAHGEQGSMSEGGFEGEEERCRPGADCLVLRDRSGATLRDDVAALVVLAGAALSWQSRSEPGPDRPGCAVPRLCEYLEGENADGAEGFVLAPVGPDFNDRLRVIDYAR